jgi:DNA polymerase III epsilon subunit-like protein
MEILIIDIETTGFLNQGGKIVEVGIISLNLETGEKKILFDSLVHERPITLAEVEKSWIVVNGYLTVENIRNSEELKNKIPEIKEIINSYPNGATAFNKSFDFDFLKSRGINFPKELPCPMILSTDVCKLPNRNGYDSYKWPKVEEAWKHFYPEIEYVELHRGADDAFHEADIVLALYKLGIFKLN